MNFTRKSEKVNPLEARYNAATAAQAAALSVFESVASDLEKAAAEQRALATDANAEIEFLHEVLFAAEDAATEAEEQAARVRSLIA